MKYGTRSLIPHSQKALLQSIRDIWLIWLTVALVTTLPYLLALTRTPADHTFTGVLSAYDDTFTYFAWIRQGADGHLLLRDLYTSESQPREFFLPLWTMVGFAARVTGLSIALMFHIARLVAAGLLLMAARTTARMITKSRKHVRFTLWLYAMSGGLGWLVYGLRNRGDLLRTSAISGSADLTMPEAIAFRSVFAQVHFPLGAALVALAITLFFTAIIERRINRALCAGTAVSVLALVHPYLVVVVALVTIVTCLIFPWLKAEGSRRANLFMVGRAAAAFAATSIPGVGYLLYLNRANEVLREWLRVTDTLSPPPQEYLLGFGIILALAVVGFCLLGRGDARFGPLLLIWAVVQTALLYAPISFQRRLVEGLQLPLTIAASVAVFWIARRLLTERVRQYRRSFGVAVIVISSLTNVGFIIGQLLVETNANSIESRRYVSNDLVAAFAFLRANADSDAVLFSHYLTGNIAPPMTGLRVFLGHYGQTIDADEKGAQVTAFYTGALEANSSRELFAANNVRFLIYGPFERASYPEFSAPSWIRLTHRFGEVDVYEVDR